MLTYLEYKLFADVTKFYYFQVQLMLKRHKDILIKNFHIYLYYMTIPQDKKNKKSFSIECHMAQKFKVYF